MHALGMLVAPLLLAVVIGLVFDLAHPRMRDHPRPRSDPGTRLKQSF